MTLKKRGLGRGLAALIPEEPINEKENTFSDGEKIVNIEIDLIEPNSEQPRKNFEEDALEELTQSIKRHGVLQPIIVRRLGKGYEIVAGERRWRASKNAGLKEMPCIIKDLEQIQYTEIALIENIQREDLNSIDEAYAYKRLIDKYSLTQDEVASVIGKSRPYISNVMRLLNLNEEVIKLISSALISNGHGRALLALEDKEVQLEVARSIIDNDLSVRETEKLVREMCKKEERKSKKTVEKVKDPMIGEIEESLRKVLGTKVQVVKGRKKGKIEIEYYSDEDLERIIEILSKN